MGLIFSYHAKDAKGEHKDGTIEATNQDDALNKLGTQGLFVISINKVQTEGQREVKDMNSVPTGRDRRKFKRVNASFLITYRIREPIEIVMKVGRIEADAVMSDLSEGGMAVLTTHDIPASTILSIKFTLIDTTKVDQNDRMKLVEAIGDVRYNFLSNKRDHRLGIQFTQISEKDKCEIANFVSRISLYGPG